MLDRAVIFCRSLDQWVLSGGELNETLADFSEHIPSTVAEIQAVSRTLDALHAGYSERCELHQNELSSLAGYLSDAPDEEIRNAIIDEALPIVRWYITDALNGKPYRKQEMMKVLEVLSVYQQKEDVSLIYKSILNTKLDDPVAWHKILNSFCDKHPYLEPFLQTLSKRPPSGYAGLAFLLLCNHAAETGQHSPHAYGSESGIKKLKSYLHPESKRPLEFAKASLRAAALLEPISRDSILKQAATHPDSSIAFIAKVTQASLGNHTEQQALASRCLDLNHGYEAQLKLEETGMASLIPEAAKDPEFLALAKCAHWLRHHEPFYKSPDHLELIDDRELFWLPQHTRVRLFLVKYKYEEPQGEIELVEGVTLVGGITHSLIGETNAEMDFTDIYGLHCCWELEHLNDPVAPRHRNAKIGKNLLRRSNAGF